MRYIAKITYIDEICAMQNQYLPLVSPFLVQYLTISISLQVLPLGQILWTSVSAKYNFENGQNYSTRFQSPLRPNIALLLVFYVQWMDECFEKIVPLHKLLCIVHKYRPPFFTRIAHLFSLCLWIWMIFMNWHSCSIGEHFSEYSPTLCQCQITQNDLVGKSVTMVGKSRTMVGKTLVFLVRIKGHELNQVNQH